MAALAAMPNDPLGGDVVKLAGQDAFRRRVGNYRKVRAVAIIEIERRTTTTYR